MKKSKRIKNKCKKYNKILKIVNLCFIICNKCFELIKNNK